MAQAFFDLGAPPKSSKAPARKGGCSSCGLGAVSKASPRFIGKGVAGILIIAEYPDAADIPELFSSPISAPLWEMEGNRFSSNILRDCVLCYALACPSKEHPKYAQAQACSNEIQAKIQEMRPKVIITMGPTSIQSLLWDRITGRIGKGLKPTDFYGHCIPDRDLNAWVVPTFSFQQLKQYLDFDRDSVPRMLFEQALRIAWQARSKPFPILPEKDRYHLVTDPLAAAGWIRTMLEEASAEEKEAAFDYETTGIKPHREGHRIVTSSFSWRRPDGKDSAVAFVWDGDAPELLRKWKRFMLSDEVGKIAHKLDFEAGWTHFRAGPGNGRVDWWPENWASDTCLAAHCIDNQGKVGLKFLAFVYLGVLGYDDRVDHYLNTLLPGENDKSKNAKNLLAKNPRGLPPGIGRSMLQYNAEDSMYTLLIRRIQKTRLSEFQMKGLEFFLDAAQELTIIQNAGLILDMDELERQWQYCTERSTKALETALGTMEARRWKAGGFNPAAPAQLGELLFDILKYPEVSGRSLDEAVLKKINTPICQAVLDLRKWTKVRDTFLEGIKREAVLDPDGNWYVRAFFNLSSGSEDEAGGPKTFRSSSDSPNLQNVPKRDKEVMAVVRAVFKVLPDEYLEEYDYKGVEVAGSACVHKDPVMIKYIEDPSNNMHTDTAADMFFRQVREVSKGERQVAKNGYVFPSFYGSGVAAIAPATWEDMPPETRKHIATRGINSFDEWKRHMYRVYDKFWNERFKVYAAWKKEVCWKFYQDHGYVELYTGFRCFGPAGFTQVTNSPIQGPSFHIQLWTLINCNREFRRRGLASQMVCQIHDAMVPRTKVTEAEEVMGIIKEYGTVKVRQHWPWIIVPLTIEAERSEQGGTWAKMTPTGVLE